MKVKPRITRFLLAMTMAATAMLHPFSGTAIADGTETLGAPLIEIADGNALIASGVGLALAQPGNININVPADATIAQVLMYWNGTSPTGVSDSTIEANGISVTGITIGNSGNGTSTAFRADITSLGLISNGDNTIAIDSLNYGVDGSAHGAGIIVIVNDGSGSTIELRDGNDFAYFPAPPPLNTTVPQTFTFAASGFERSATLTLFASEVSGTFSTGDSGIFRPTAIEITVGGVTTVRDNLLNSYDGEEWDTLVLNDVDIPAGATELTVQLLSADNGADIPEGERGEAASFFWLTAGLSVPPPVLAKLGDRVWEDLNKNGIQDCFDGAADDDNFPADGIIGNAGDEGDECGSGIERVTVLLGSPDDKGECVATGPSVVTNEFGFYEFDNLPSGDYCVVVNKNTLPSDFCTTDGIDLGDPQFTMKNAGGDTVDSDVDPSTGGSDSVSLNSGDVNLTVDAGVYCAAKLGDRVWLDDDKNGLQDLNDAGIPGVTVNLLDCGSQQVGLPPQNAPLLRTTTTEGPDGMYMFGGPGREPLLPGNYAVEFVKPDGFDFTLTDAGINDAIDSDANANSGRTVCMPLASREYNPTKDGGLIPKGCNVVVDKKCVIPPPPPVSFDKCKGKLQQFTVKWNGSGAVTVNGLGKTDLAVNVGDEVTFTGPFSQNDVEIQLAGTADGKSVFHMSCSDEDFNDPSDCGKDAGDGKGTNSGLINQWKLEGFVDAEGRVLDCTSDVVDAGADSCTISLADGPSCETLGKPSSLTFVYTGDGAVSGCTDNAASSAGVKEPTCSGDLAAGATVLVSVNDGSVTPTSVAPGEEFTITGFGSNTEVTLTSGSNTEVDAFHTSCSAPLEAGDVFGNLKLVGFNGQRSSVNVTYNYEVTNIGVNDVVNILVNDDVLGRQVTGSPVLGPLAPGESVKLTEIIPVDATVTNTANVTANTQLGGVCTASDSVTVTVAGPPPCNVSGENKLKEVKDDKIKWKLINNGTKAATIKSVTVTFPLEHGQVKKLKLEGDFFDGSAGGNGTATLNVDDFNKGGLKERQLKAGDSKELEIQFTTKAKDKQDADYTIVVEFEEGCIVEFKK